MQLAPQDRTEAARLAPSNVIDRRTLLCAAIACTGSAAFAARLPVVRTSPIRWAGANGRTLHGYMAIPERAHGRQPAVLVIGDGGALPPAADPVARKLVEQLAAAGLLACTADNVTVAADLRASLAWLRFNRYATGKVALAGFGRGAGIASRLAASDGDILGALLLLNATPIPDSASVPVLSLAWREEDAALPPGAAAFLKEHLA